MPKTVIHDHDGHVDDLLSCILLWLSPEIDLQAVGITNGDCYAPQIFEATQKIATLLDIDGPEIALTEDEIPNPFPDNWRRESYIINELPLFRDNYLKKTYQQGKPRRIDSVFLDCLSNSRSPLTVVSTGPLTNMASYWRSTQSLKKKSPNLSLWAEPSRSKAMSKKQVTTALPSGMSMPTHWHLNR
ncbi:MAG: nucleoside hydrolase [Candidatus Obscuribacter sp.]|nr:nucleoside hydrolase [Candidatus Obscuribacter sp.]